MRLLLLAFAALGLAAASSQAAKVEAILEKYKAEVTDSLKTKTNTLRNLLVGLDFRQSDGIRTAIGKLKDFQKGPTHPPCHAP